jgi:two-component system response regulator RegX3
MNHAKSKRAPVLIAGADATFTEALCDDLRASGIETLVAADGAGVPDQVAVTTPSLVIIDQALPRQSALDLCRVIRASSAVPILVVAAGSHEADRVSALELGADDVADTSSTRELVARVRALLRRAYPPSMPDLTIECGPVRLDLDRYAAWVRGAPVVFRPKEFYLLAALASRCGRVLTRDFLLDEVWGFNGTHSPKVVDVHVRRVRSKVESDPGQPEHLLTIRGVGYKFVG